MTKPICVVDFDGTIHDLSGGFQGDDVFGAPIMNAHQYVNRLYHDGWLVAISSTRKFTPRMWYWLIYHGFKWHCCNGWWFEEVIELIGRRYGFQWSANLKKNAFERLPKGEEIPPRVWPFNPANASAMVPNGHVFINDRDWFSYERGMNWKMVYEMIVYRFYRKEMMKSKAQTVEAHDATLFIANMKMGACYGEEQYPNAELRNPMGVIRKPATAPELPEEFLDA